MSKFHPTHVMGVAAGCVWLTLGGPAVAFFPPLPLGTEPVTVLPPPALPVTPTAPPTETPEIPVVPPPPFVPPPPPRVVPQEVPPCTCTPETPQVVPEPASLVSAAAGLAAVAAAYRKRRGRQAVSR